MAFPNFKSALSSFFGSIFQAKPKQPSIKSMLQEVLAANKRQQEQIEDLQKRLAQQEQEKQALQRQLEAQQKAHIEELKKINEKYAEAAEKLNKTAEEASLYETIPEPEPEPEPFEYDEIEPDLFDTYEPGDINYYIEGEQLAEIDEFLNSENYPGDLPAAFLELPPVERSAYISEYLQYQWDMNPYRFYDPYSHSWYDDVKNVPIWGAEFNNWFNNQELINNF